MIKVLIIDNDVNTVETIKGTISTKTKYQVETAYSGAEGIEKMKEKTKPDLVLLDIMMPKMSGIEVCRVMLEDEKMKKIPVILTSALPVSSKAFQGSMGKFGELSVIKDTLEKPFLSDDLIKKINKILGD